MLCLLSKFYIKKNSTDESEKLDYTNTLLRGIFKKHLNRFTRMQLAGFQLKI